MGSFFRFPILFFFCLCVVTHQSFCSPSFPRSTYHAYFASFIALFILSRNTILCCNHLHSLHSFIYSAFIRPHAAHTGLAVWTRFLLLLPLLILLRLVLCALCSVVCQRYYVHTAAVVFSSPFSRQRHRARPLCTSVSWYGM